MIESLYDENETNLDEIEQDKFNFNESLLPKISKKDWHIAFNSNLNFPINPYDYEDIKDYLKDLRIEWQKQYDPQNKFDINPQLYYNFETYLNDLRFAWKKYYDLENEFDVDPNDYFSEEEYSIAINDVKQRRDFMQDSDEIILNEVEMKLREEWKDKYDPVGDYITNPYYCETEDEYLKTLQLEWKDRYDFYDNYSYIVPFEYTSGNEYLRELQKAWIKKYDPNKLITKINGYSYEEEDYLNDLREAWKQLYDGEDNYSSNPVDFNNMEEYLSSLRNEWKNKYDKDNLFLYVDPADYSNEYDYLFSLRNAWEIIFNENYEYDINVQGYESIDEYLKDLKNAWKLRYDSDNKFNNINPNDYFSELEYKKAIQSSSYNENELSFNVYSEETAFTNVEDGCVIYLEIENRTNTRINVKVIESCIVNNEKEQRSRDSRLEGYQFEEGKILPNAKRKRGDIFYSCRAGNLSDGWIYYAEINDEVNCKKYMISYMNTALNF